MRREVKLAGAGGQGIVTMAVLLAEAAGQCEGLEIAQTQSYGPEARGGASRSEVVISDEPIDYIKTLDPDVLVAMSQPAFDQYVRDVDPARALVFVDETLVADHEARGQPAVGLQHLYRVPATRLAVERCGTATVANTVMLTVVAFVSGVVRADSLRCAIERQANPKHRQGNLNAFQVALDYCAAQGLRPAGEDRRRPGPPVPARRARPRRTGRRGGP